MELRLDLLKYLTAEEAAASMHCHGAEPVFSKTGKGFLKTATQEEKRVEFYRMEALKEHLLKDRVAKEERSK